ncbi:unnamed protein product [Schistosoma turkestanicum]|nr:unnamed protein product [Schistosoma turkestanicum]
MKNQSNETSSPMRRNFISQPDNSQYHQLVTIGSKNSLKSQFHDMNQNTSYLTDMKEAQTPSRIISQCEYVIQGFFYDHMNLKENETNHITDGIVGQIHGDENKYPLRIKSTVFAENNLSNQHTLITKHGSVVHTNNLHIIDQNNSYATVFKCTLINPVTNITINHLYKSDDFHQITFINWLKLINNVLWILLLVLQIPVMIKLKKIFPKILRLRNGLLFVHIIAINLTGWFYMAFIGTENYLRHYREYSLNKTYDIRSTSGNFNKLPVMRVMRSSVAYLLNYVAHSHLLVVVLIWISWNSRRLIKNLQDSGDTHKKNRLVHWEKESCSLTPIHHVNAVISSSVSRSTSIFTNRFYRRCERNSCICGLLSLLSVIICIINLFAYKLSEYRQIVLCNFSYFLILVFTISQIILLVYSSTHNVRSKRSSTYPRNILKNFNWIKSNLLSFLLLFQLTGSICFNLMQVIEILINLTDSFTQEFDTYSSFFNTSIESNSLSIRATEQTYTTYQYHQISQQELFLKYFILFTLCLEMIENGIEIMYIPLIMVKFFIHRITKPTFFTMLMISLITNQFCLLIMKFFNPQLLILENEYVLNCFPDYPNGHHNMTNRNTAGSINNSHGVTPEVLVTNTNTITTNETNFITTNKIVEEILNLVQFSIIPSNWWYWTFIKQLSLSVCFIFRQSMLICCWFLYLT